MQIAIDIRLLSTSGCSGIKIYTACLVDELIKHREHVFQLFYNGLHNAPLPTHWLSAPHVTVINWHIPNKLLYLTHLLNIWKSDLPTGQAGFPTSAVFFSPHFHYINPNTTPHVITFHDLSFIHHPQFFTPYQRLWHRMQRVQLQADHAQKIIAVSEYTKYDLITTLGVPESKITVVYSGIRPLLRKLSAAELQRLTPPPYYDGRPFILFIGTLEPRKNILAIIRAWNIMKHHARFNDLLLYIAGAPGWSYKEIFCEAHLSPFYDSIKFIGPVDVAQELFLYNKCSAFVYPSFFEGFGFPPLEAQACGAPVIASNRTSLPETLGTSALLVDPWKVHELVDAITDCLDHSSTRASLIARGAQNAKRFHWDIAATKTLSLLHDSATTHS